MTDSKRFISGASRYSWPQMRRRALFGLELLQLTFTGTPPICPYCGSRQVRRLGRKALLLTAQKCEFCGLIFRWPTESVGRIQQYYQEEYVSLWENTTGVQREIASGEMQQLIATHFKDSKYDYTPKLQIVQQLTGSTSGRLLDFGCGWGYITYQANRLGWDAEGFDLAKPYAEFARQHLGLTIHTDLDYLTNRVNFNQYDIIFTHHVLEHLTNLRAILDNFYRLLKPNGLLVIVVPNAGSAQSNHSALSTLGQNHISAFTREWFINNLGRHAFTIEKIISAPYVFDRNQPGFAETLSVLGFEIMVIARRGLD